MSSGGGGALSFIGDAWNDISGTSAAAAAAERAGNATLEQQRSDRERALGFAAPSPQELQSLQEAIDVNSRDINRRERLLASADPALIEAGSQALQLMQGKEASTLAPVRNQRAQQRKQLEQTLAQQLGPDYATSSAGIQALSAFDAQTSDLMATQQNQTLAQFMGYTTNAAQLGNTQGNVGASSSLAQQRGQMGVRQANVLGTFDINPSLKYAGDAVRAQGYQTGFNTAAAVGAAAMGGAGGAGGWAGVADYFSKKDKP